MQLHGAFFKKLFLNSCIKHILHYAKARASWLRKAHCLHSFAYQAIKSRIVQVVHAKIDKKGPCLFSCVLSGQRHLLPLINRNGRRFVEKGRREHKKSIISASGRARDVCVCRWPLHSPVWLTSEARARAPAGTKDVTCACVQRRVSERAKQLRTRIWMWKESESVQWAQRISKRRRCSCRGWTPRHATQRGVVGHREMRRKRIWQVAGVAHHVAVKGWVGWVRPGHRQPLPLVLHTPVLEPDLKLKAHARLLLNNVLCMFIF